MRILIVIIVILAAAVVLMLVRPAPVGGEGWLTDYEQALAESQQTGKPILASFSGSDWCPPCIALDDDVFESEKFSEWAGENVILLFLDFPRGKPQSDEVRAQNDKLATQYGVDGYPTVVFLDSQGVEFGRLGGYGGSGADAWIGQAQKILETAPAPTIAPAPVTPSPASGDDAPAAEELRWFEDVAAAKALAAQSDRPVMLNFSGSDWCKFCWALDDEIFSTPQFTAFAKDNLVLVLVDFPEHKPQSQAVKDRNEQLRLRYRVEGFPTLVILSPEGQKLGTMYYEPAGPAKFLQDLKRVLGDE